MRLLALTLCCWLSLAVPAKAADDDSLRIAVAANFSQPLLQLLLAYANETGEFAVASSASTGVLYTQIRHGAPFDVFLAADAERPALLVDSGDALPDSLHGLLAEIGRVYAPFLLGNAAALESGAEQVDCEIDGARWVQKPFPYQGKCLQWLREGHAALSADDRACVDATLAGTGCEALFQA